MSATDPAVTAAAEALSIIGGVPDIWDLRAAGIAVAAARPIIEAEVRAQPDRPRAQPDERIVYLPVRVTFEGLADPTNGPYFKGLVQMSSAYPETTYSISESQVLTREQVEAEVRERIAADIEAERDRVWIEPNLVLVNGAQVLDRHVYAAQWTEAARIARGQS